VHARYGYVVAKPRFVPHDDGLRLANVPLVNRPKQVAEAGPEWSGLERSFYLARLVSRWKNVSLLRRAGEVVGLSQLETGRVGRYFDPQALRAKGWPITVRLLEALKSDTLEAGTQLVVFYIPTPAMGPEDEALATMLGEACAASSIAFLDPTERFRAESASSVEATGSGLYHPKDGHWNAAGHALAARLLAEFLVTQGLTD
jgi:hypothetical protein